ncbi:MAG: protein translocase subunit SecD [Omnitrophica WOR_2 bacterium]
MKQYRSLIIAVAIILAVFLDLPNVPAIFGKQISTHLGLDLVGGVQALLEADTTTNPSAEEMSTARSIVQNRVNGLGVSEAVVQSAGGNRIVVEIPGVSNPDEAIKTIKTTGLLEFVDFSNLSATEAQALVGTTIKTDFAQSTGSTPVITPTAQTTPTVTAALTATATRPITTTPTLTTTAAVTATSTITATGTVSGTGSTAKPATPSQPVYHTVMTGTTIKNVGVQATTVGAYEVAFELNSTGAKTFADYTASHVGKILAIVLDKQVVSTPSINNAIPDGKGVITGGFTQETANNLAVQLRYGSLPIPLKVVESNSVGPTLGQDSLRKSLVAGAIGLGAVILFMALYYRLNGIIADLALVCYALFAYALFRVIPVTLTLPGIAGFVLSIGMAVDANILIFERMKEELRSGRSLRAAIDLGWSRAWPSIRDSNISTLITCAVLYIFGSTYGASIVKGFSFTLAIGVLVSLFTAVVVTRTFLHLVLDNLRFTEHPMWFGVE